ncbi:YbaB/EbfC family nucleoid-associated protein [Amycolatopsis taiwanensis]|uniref:YbaB/EbfC DNA-binding family protein n=1 Tax=Amycolatopsis taiwanensis TaxID=342230 RepID=A0A9W6R973_9PSEU|nr:YbaB/EbfC family nucleoid-associated protein [Amycolatopsis taiwanensis]GLY71218.1 hypothetical protein Atai01_78370 [Amycolatopsis taiwanensis]
MTEPTPGNGDDPTARVDRWMAEARAKAERYRSMQSAVGGVSVTESSKDGLVSVTVDSAGNVTDLKLSDRVREMSGAQVSSAVLLTLRRAQSRLPEQLGEIMAATIGEDQQTVETIVGNYRAKFPEPEDPDEAPEQAASGEVRRIGELEEAEEAPAPPPARPARPPQPAPPAASSRPARPQQDDDDDDWGDQSFLVRK